MTAQNIKLIIVFKNQKRHIVKVQTKELICFILKSYKNLKVPISHYFTIKPKTA